MRNIELIRTVTSNAAGQWPKILESLGIDVPGSSQIHGPCPACAGRDRFRFDDKGRGAHFCNQCGAGDGLDLVKKVNQCGVTEAARLVAEVLKIDYQAERTASQGKAIVENKRQQAEGVAQEQKRQQFARRYIALYNKASPGESVYLTAKGLTGFTFPLLADGSLLVALTDESGAVRAAQTISAEGSKKLVAGSSKRGAFYVVIPQEQPETVIITEGLATTLTVHLLRPDALAVCAIDAGNLLPVAEAMRRKYPDVQIIIAADNDITPGEPNTGKEAANKAAKCVSGWLTLPPTDYKADWDDYRQAHGLGAATRKFNAGLYRTVKEQRAVTGDRNEY